MAFHVRHIPACTFYTSHFAASIHRSVLQSLRAAASAVVENIEKKREPLLSISGVYFITPTDRSVQRLLDDWKVRPMYKTAHVFFTSKVSPVHLQVIKNCSGLAQRLRSLKEVSLRFVQKQVRSSVA